MGERLCLDFVPRAMAGVSITPVLPVTGAAGAGKTGWKGTKDFSLVCPFPHLYRNSAFLYSKCPEAGIHLLRGSCELGLLF